MPDQTLKSQIVLETQKAVSGLKEFNSAAEKTFEGISAGANNFKAVLEGADAKFKSFGEKLREKFDIKPTLSPVYDLKALREGQYKIKELTEELAHKQAAHIRLTDPEEIRKSLSELRTARRALGQTQAAVKALENQAQESGGPIGKLGEMLKSKFAMAGAAAGVGLMVDKMFEAGKEAQKTNAELQASFAGNDAAFKEANENAEKLAKTYNLDADSIKGATQAYVDMGGPTDNISQKQEMILALMNKTHLSATSAAQLLAKTLESPTNALSRYGVQFEKGATQAEKLAAMQKALAPNLTALGEQANDSSLGFEHAQVQMKEFEEEGGQIITQLLAPLAQMLSVAIGWVRDLVGWFKQAPGPIQVLVKYGGMFVVGLGAIGAATLAVITLTKLDLAQKVAQGIADMSRLATMALTKVGLLEEGAALSFSTIATVAQTAATWALNAAMIVLMSPVTWIIAGIALLAAGVIYAYNHFAFFKNFVDGLWAALKTLWGKIEEGIKWVGHLAQSIINSVPPIKALVDAVKGAVSWIGKLFSSDAADKADKLTDKVNEQKQAVDDLGASWGDAEKKYEDYVDAMTKKSNVGAYKQEIDTVKKEGAELQGQYNLWLVNLAKAKAAGNQKDIDFANNQLQQLKDRFAVLKQTVALYNQNEDAAEKALSWDDDKDKEKQKQKVAHAKSALSQILSDQIKFENEKQDLNQQSAQTTLDNISKLQAFAQNANIVLTDDDKKHLAELNLGRKKAGLDALSDTEYIAHLRAQAEDVVTKAVEAQQKKIADLRKAADTKELTSYEQKKAAIADAEDKARKAQKDALDKGIITQEQYDANLLAIQAKANADYLAAQKEYEDKKLKDQLDALNKSIELEKKGVEDKAKIAVEQAGDDPMKKQAADTAQKLALLNIDYEQSVKTAELKGEDTTAITQEYEDKKTALLDAANKEREKLVLDDLKKNNLAFQSAMTGVQAMFSEMSKAVQTTLGNLFGWEKTEWQKMSATEQALAISDKNKKIQALTDEVRTNKITYQDYMLQKQKLDDDLAKKQKKNAIDVGQITTSVEKSITDGVISNLEKRAAAWVADQLERLALSLVYKATDTAQTIATATAQAAAWAPAAAMAATATLGGAALAGTAALTTSVATAETEAVVAHGEGGVYDPREHGGKYRIAAIGEKNEKEFVAPERTALDYFQKDFGPRLMGRMGLQNMIMRGGGVPEIHPNLSATSAMRSQGIDPKHLAKFNEIMEHIGKNGIDITGKLDAKLSPRESEKATRARNQRVNTRASVTGGGMTAKR